MNAPVMFYLPKRFWPDSIPTVYDNRWPGFGEGYYNWTLQTHLLLRDHGINTELLSTIENRPGIIISHRALLDAKFKPASDQILVCMQADWGRHPYAQAHICQNKAQTTGEGRRYFYQLFWPAKTYFVHHWPQPALIKRNSKRPSRLNCLSYFGLDYNLAPELRSEDWTEFLSNLSIEWRVVDQMKDWDNFQETDAVLFCRDFDGNQYYNKPATKLYNTWLAECLPICTPESAFLQECSKDEAAAIIVDTYSELKQEIRKLKENPDLFTSRLEAAIKKSSSYTNARIVNEWAEILEELQGDYKKFKNRPLTNWLFMRIRGLSVILLKAFGKLSP